MSKPFYKMNPEATFYDRAPFDFDGDGKTDIGLFRPSKNKIRNR